MSSLLQQSTRYSTLLALILTFASASAISAQSESSRRVIGTVTEPGGRPIAHASISGPWRAPVVVDDKGHFSVLVPEGAVTLIARALGYSPVETRVAPNATTVTLVLEAQPFVLGEITISGNESEHAHRLATTASANVSAERLTEAPAQSIEQALQGKVLGASINMNTGAPGGGGQIQIRGTSSILGNGEPLIVIDGVISSNDAYSAGASTVTRGGASQDQNVNRLADINPAEIESVDIVKDASATAIYGSRASNGVVVIRTKRGKAGRTRFTFDQQVGTSSLLRSLGYRQFSSVAEVLALRFGATTNAAAQSYLQSHFPNGTISPEANVDLEREFFNNHAPSRATTLSVSGGTPSLRYLASATQRDETGIASNNGARLQSVRLNVDQTISDRLTSTVSVDVVRNRLERGFANNDNSFTSPVYAFAYTPAVFDLDVRDASGNFVRNPIFGGGISASNPFETYEYVRYVQDVWRTIGSLGLTYSILQNAGNQVTARLFGGFDRYNQAGDLYSPGFLQYEGRNNLFGTSEKSNYIGLNYNIQPTITWNAALSRVGLTTTLGASRERQRTTGYALIGRGLVPGSQLASQGTLSATDTLTEFRDQALFLNEQITALNERLIINGGVRGDRSSADGDPSKFYVFPRASAAFRPIAKAGVFDGLKLRAGWGQTGNRPRFGDRERTLSAGGIVQGQTSIQVASVIGNPDIKPETLTEISGGVDASLFGGRLDLEATVYRRTITDLLLQPPAPPSSGFSTLVINGGELRNQGIELGLTGVPIKTRSLSVSSRVAFQKHTELVVSLPASVPPFSPPNSFGASFGRNRVTAGRTTSEIWGNVPIDASGNILPVGSYVTNPTLIAARVDTVIGNANPKFQIFLENTVQWKHLTLAFTLDWRNGGDVANTTTKLYDEGGTSRDFTAKVTAENVPRGVHADEIQKIPSTLLGLGDFRYQSWSGGSDARIYLQDGSYLKLRDISIGVTAPKAFASKIRAESLRLSLEGRNVALWTHYWGYDPEFNNYGNQNLNRFIDTAPYPGARSFYVSLNLVY